MDRFCIGYDLREFDASLPPSNYDAIYLLRHLGAWPWTIDRMVWPSVQKVGDVHTHPATDLMYSPELFAKIPEGIKGTRVAFEFCGSINDASGDGYWNWCGEGITPVPREAGWVLSGFDIADRNFTSGLSNCGYDPEEIAELRP